MLHYLYHRLFSLLPGCPKDTQSSLWAQKQLCNLCALIKNFGSFSIKINNLIFFFYNISPRINVSSSRNGIRTIPPSVYLNNRIFLKSLKTNCKHSKEFINYTYIGVGSSFYLSSPNPNYYI